MCFRQRGIMELIKIAHRGNTKGKKSKNENKIYYINEALASGYHCEIDVWWLSDKFYLGHDEPTIVVDVDFLGNDKLICHAKNVEALHEMLKNTDIHCFWHEDDFCTITSKGYVWKYPEVYFGGKLWGICSDYL